MTESNTSTSHKPGPAKIALLVVLAIAFVVVLLLPDKQTDPPPAAAADGNRRRPPVRRPQSPPPSATDDLQRPTAPLPKAKLDQVTAYSPFDFRGQSEKERKESQPAKMVQKSRVQQPSTKSPIDRHPLRHILKKPVTMRIQSGDRVTIGIGDRIIHQGRDDKRGVWLGHSPGKPFDLRLFPPKPKQAQVDKP